MSKYQTLAGAFQSAISKIIRYSDPSIVRSAQVERTGFWCGCLLSFAKYSILSQLICRLSKWVWIFSIIFKSECNALFSIMMNFVASNWYSYLHVYLISSSNKQENLRNESESPETYIPLQTSGSEFRWVCSN